MKHYSLAYMRREDERLTHRKATRLFLLLVSLMVAGAALKTLVFGAA